VHNAAQHTARTAGLTLGRWPSRCLGAVTVLAATLPTLPCSVHACPGGAHSWPWLRTRGSTLRCPRSQCQCTCPTLPQCDRLSVPRSTLAHRLPCRRPVVLPSPGTPSSCACIHGAFALAPAVPRFARYSGLTATVPHVAMIPLSRGTRSRCAQPRFASY